MESSRLRDPRALIAAGYGLMFFFIPLSHSPVEICGVFVMAVWLLSRRALDDTRRWLASATAPPILILMALPWIGLLLAPAPAQAMATALKTRYWLYAIPLISATPLFRPADLPLRMFLAGLSLNCVVSLLQVAGILHHKYSTPSGLLTISSPWITYSLLLAFGLLVASFLFKKGTSRDRLLCGGLIVLFFVTLGFVGGRSGYLALLVLSPLIAHNLVGRRGFIMTLLVCLLVVCLLLSFSTVQDRFSRALVDLNLFEKGHVNTALGQRLHMWSIALDDIRQSPIIGHGTDSFRTSWEIRKGDPLLPFHDHPHNSFLYLMVSYGIAGLIGLCWLIAVLIVHGWRRRTVPLGFAVLSFTIVFTVGSLTDTQLLPFPTAIALSLFAGVAGGLNEYR